MPKHAVFNRSDVYVLTWYFLMPSKKLRKGQVKAVRALGRDLVVYRSESGRVYALDAHCPHMGAHLAEGRVEGEQIRCFFHNWRLDAQGKVSDVPCLSHTPKASIPAYPVEERYGLIWLWPGEAPEHALPVVPELEGHEVVARLGTFDTRACHPTVVMVNAIDTQHFHSVHNLPAKVDFEISSDGGIRQTFKNIAPIERTNFIYRMIAKLYAGPARYELCYQAATNAAVTLGPDFLHCHIIFANRPTDEGGTDVQLIQIQPKRRGLGRLVTAFALRLTGIVGRYFAKGDGHVFRTIEFDYRTPVAADRSVIAYMREVDRMPTIERGTWTRAGDEPSTAKALGSVDVPLQALRRGPDAA